MELADQPINPADANLSPDFYSDIAVFKVEDTIFKVPRQGLVEASPLFEKLFLLPSAHGKSEGQSNDNPIILEGYKACDFDALMRMVYPRSRDLVAGSTTLTKDQWIGVLRLSTIWKMKEIREFAIGKLSNWDPSLTPFEKVALARDHKVAPWLLEGLISLASDSRISPESLEEAMDLCTAFRLIAIRLKLAPPESELAVLRLPSGNWTGLRISDLAQNCCWKSVTKDMLTAPCQSCSGVLRTDRVGSVYMQQSPMLKTNQWNTFLEVKPTDIRCALCHDQFIKSITTSHHCGRIPRSNNLYIFLAYHPSCARKPKVENLDVSPSDPLSKDERVTNYIRGLIVHLVSTHASAIRLDQEPSAICHFIISSLVSMTASEAVAAFFSLTIMAIASIHPSSPFAAWIRTNRTLPPSELDCLNRLLGTQHIELAELDQRIHEIQQALEQRKAEQERLKADVYAHRSLLSPIRRLPAEVLQQIFLLCRAAHRMPLLRKEEAPVLLTRVSRAWRNLALDTPHLWDSIHIPIPHGATKPSAQFHLHRAERWLERTKEVPLSISIWSPRENIEDCEEFLKEFLRRNVLDRAPRIRCLELEINYTLLNFICTTLPPDSWATLEKVTFRCVDVGPVIEQMAVWEAPCLRGVVWESVKADIFNLPLAWDQLEEIKVSEDPRSRGSWDEDWDTFSASEAHALIRDSPNLRHLKINIDGDGTQFFLEGVHHHYPISLENPLVLPQLTTLELYDMHLDPALGPVVFLRGLQLPVLESLTYQLVSQREHTISAPFGPQPHGEAHPLIAFLGSQKEPIRIKALKIDEGWTMSQDDFLRCLEMMPLLEKVWVAYWSGTPPPSIQRRTDPDKEIAPTPSLLRRLQPSKRDPSQIFCPRITSLRFDKMEDVEFEDIEIFVRDRLALADAFPLVSTASPTSSNPTGVARLRHVHIGMPKLRPDHVPRSYRWNVRQPICSLEEDLRELGVDARFVLWPANSEQDMRKLTKERYLPHCGLFYG